MLLRETKSDQLKALSCKEKKNIKKNRVWNNAGGMHFFGFRGVSAYAGSNSRIFGFLVLLKGEKPGFW